MTGNSKSPHNPFAVIDIDLGNLPKVVDLNRVDFETKIFGPIWVEYMGGMEAASRFVLREYGPVEKRRGERNLKINPASSVRALELTVDGAWTGSKFWGEDFVVPGEDPVDRLEKGLAFTTLIDENGGRLNKDLMKTFPLALDVESKWKKRSDDALRALQIGELRAKGWENPRAINLQVAERPFFGETISINSLSDKCELDSMEEIASVRDKHLKFVQRPGVDTDVDKVREGIKAGKVPRYPHSSDAWFKKDDATNEVDVSVANGIAQYLINEMRNAGKASIGIRWAILNLIEGFNRLDLPLSDTVQCALDYALGLVEPGMMLVKQHKKGKAKEVSYSSISLGGIAHRDAFIAFVEEMIADNLDYPDEASSGLQKKWFDLPIYDTAFNHLGRRKA